MGTRPTPSRVREALFSIIAAHLPQARVLDLFAGTGALGIEALSRGAAQAVFVEQDDRVVALLRRNLKPFATQSQVMAAAANASLTQLAAKGALFDVVFVDPPYAKQLLQPTLQALVENAMLAPGALVICEHASKAAGPKAVGFLALLQSRVFGDVAITLFGMPDSFKALSENACKGGHA